MGDVARGAVFLAMAGGRGRCASTVGRSGLTYMPPLNAASSPALPRGGRSLP